MPKSKVLFFSRNYQSSLFPAINTTLFDTVHVTLTVREKMKVEMAGGIVVGCLEEEYHKLLPIEIEFPYLTYSMGADRFLRGMSHDERLIVLKKTVAFWRGILENYRPFCLVNEPVAIEASEVLMIEAQRLKITYLTFGSFFKDNTFYFYEYSPKRKALFEKNNSIEPTESDRRIAETLIQDIKKGYKPSYVKNISHRKSISRLYKLIHKYLLNLYFTIKIRDLAVRQLCYGMGIDRVVWQTNLYLRSYIYSFRYDRISVIDNSKYRYLLFPLHLEPEAVLYYGAPYYDNQITFIENILKCICEDHVLIVKEHPQQPGYLLQKSFRKIKDRFPNVLYLQSEIDSRVLINKVETIITLGGSTGFEGLVFNKKVINYGRVFYDAFEGVINMHSYEELAKYLRYDDEPENVNADLAGYVAKIIQLLNNGNPFPHTQLYSEDNIYLISNAFEREFLRIFNLKNVE